MTLALINNIANYLKYNYFLDCDGIDNVTLRLWKFSDFCSRHTVGVAGDDIMFHILVAIVNVYNLGGYPWQTITQYTSVPNECGIKHYEPMLLCCKFNCGIKHYEPMLLCCKFNCGIKHYEPMLLCCKFNCGIKHYEPMLLCCKFNCGIKHYEPMLLCCKFNWTLRDKLQSNINQTINPFLSAKCIWKCL